MSADLLNFVTMTDKGEAKKVLTQIRSDFDCFFIFASINGQPMAFYYADEEGQIEDTIYTMLSESDFLFDMFDELIEEAAEDKDITGLN